jgi:hypothetical protein
MHDAGGYPSRELARDQEAGVFALHLDRTLEGVEKLVHVMKVPGDIDIHTIADMCARLPPRVWRGHRHETGWGIHGIHFGRQGQKFGRSLPDGQCGMS